MPPPFFIRWVSVDNYRILHIILFVEHEATSQACIQEIENHFDIGNSSSSDVLSR